MAEGDKCYVGNAEQIKRNQKVGARGNFQSLTRWPGKATSEGRAGG